MNAMCAWKSSGDQSLIWYSPFPRGAFIIIMYFMGSISSSGLGAQAGAFVEKSEAAVDSLHPG
jgi:hypothetical protein